MAETWTLLRALAQAHIADNPELEAFLQAAILDYENFEDALVKWISGRLVDPHFGLALIRPLIREAFAAERSLVRGAEQDLLAIRERDPACECLCAAFLFNKGYHALQAHRAAHWLWQNGRRLPARVLHHRCAEVLGIDIHPAARIGVGVMLDHGTGFVAGETVVIGDGASLLHSVTLGGTGKESGDRHPKIGRGAYVGAGAVILGNIEIGAGARIGAGSVVLQPVPMARTAVGQCARLTDRMATVSVARMPAGVAPVAEFVEPG